eukprot:augustus_masked-scaffold_4-processed-gene-12.41-mRNA-1 protein AED:0.01 eAED:0.01 QI:0/-1/0/1/-1/1/1/0/439
MNLLVIGGGGREDALSATLLKSQEVDKIYIAPGNGSVLDNLIPISLPVSKPNFEKVVEFLKEKEISLVVVGPEVPLVDGLVDHINSTLPYVIVFGPCEAAARLEGSKAFAKEFMQRNKIPTAEHNTFSSSSDALEYIKNKLPETYVLKYSGLAAGKGVILPNSKEEAESSVISLLSKEGDELVIEERLFGVEISVFAICSGKKYILLPIMQDYKQALDGDEGLNTGGMGSHTSIQLPETLINEIEEKIVEPTVEGCVKEGFPFVGVIYFGLMVTKKGVKVIEYNCRFGDPEAEVLLPILGADVFGLVKAAGEGTLSDEKRKYLNSSTKGMTVVLTSRGYPKKYEKGKEIEINEVGLKSLAEKENMKIEIFHAGTKRQGDKLLTNGGRVLNVVVLGEGIESQKLKNICYEAVKFVQFEGITYRKDIGYKLVSPDSLLTKV